MGLSEKQRIEVLMILGYGDRKRSMAEVCEIFNEKYPNREPLSKSTVSKILHKFNEIGNVRNKPKSGRPTVAEDTQLNVLLGIEENPHCSITTLSENNEICRGAVHKILRAAKLHPYKIKLIHELNEDDFDRRMEFCEIMQEVCNQNDGFEFNVLFSDESTFFTNGTVNKQNCRYWAPENPNWTMEAHTQYPQKVTVWAGILRNTIVGPYFFDGTVTGGNYLEMLQTYVVPYLTETFPDINQPDRIASTIWFHQDGAGPHYARVVRDFLNESFPNRWIGRRGQIEWPARSPDLTPMDFFLWGYLKSKVYINRPTSLEDLKERIRTEIQRITPDMLSNVTQEFTRRLGYCQLTQGAQFEHLL